MKIPRLLIAGTHSGVGKTSVTAGLCLALRRAGVRVQPFKAGPDYIDPGFLSQAAARRCRNLDTWLVPRARLPALFARGCGGAELAVIEGVMGLYDGVGATSEAGSTAELAKLLDCPVLLVLDASAVSRSAAAVVRGFVELDRKVPMAGCILNRLSGAAHFRLVKEGIERLARVPVLGWLPEDRRFHLPERHLGLVPSQENQGGGQALSRLAGQVRATFDLPAIRRIAGRAEPLELEEGALRRAVHPELGRRMNGLLRANGPVPIAVAQDEAFHFYYPENWELLGEMGAELVPFSPLRDRGLPRGVGGLYLGGGFPELFAGDLARNGRMRESIRRAVLSGLPTYAECGGLMVLARSIRDLRGKRHPMVGLVPAHIRMTDRLQNFGYQEVRSVARTVLSREGERARGHEFHHSVMEPVPERACAVYETRARSGGRASREGYTRGSLVASYIHLHFWSQPRWAERFVQSARHYQTQQTEVGKPVKVGRCPATVTGTKSAR